MARIVRRWLLLAAVALVGGSGVDAHAADGGAVDAAPEAGPAGDGAVAAGATDGAASLDGSLTDDGSASDGGDDSMPGPAGPPLKCDGALCDTSNGAACAIGRSPSVSAEWGSPSSLAAFALLLLGLRRRRSAASKGSAKAARRALLVGVVVTGLLPVSTAHAAGGGGGGAGAGGASAGGAGTGAAGTTAPGGTSDGNAPPANGAPTSGAARTGPAGSAGTTSPNGASPTTGTSTPVGETSTNAAGPNHATAPTKGMPGAGGASGGAGDATRSGKPSGSSVATLSSAPLPPVDVRLAHRPAHRWLSLELNPVALLINRISLQAVIVLGQHHALVLNPYFVSVGTAPIAVFDANNNPTQLPKQSFTAVGGELGYRYYFGAEGPRGAFLGGSLLLAYVDASAMNGTDTTYLRLGLALDAGYAAIIADRVTLSVGAGLEGALTTSQIPQQQFPARTIANGGVLPRVLASLGWAF